MLVLLTIYSYIITIIEKPEFLQTFLLRYCKKGEGRIMKQIFLTINREEGHFHAEVSKLINVGCDPDYLVLDTYASQWTKSMQILFDRATSQFSVQLLKITFKQFKFKQQLLIVKGKGQEIKSIKKFYCFMVSYKILQLYALLYLLKESLILGIQKYSKSFHKHASRLNN